MWAYYNENDPYTAQWLRNLIAAGHIANGVVDERSIRDVRPDDLFEYTQCHFFAGIGVWSLALRRAGWPDDKPVWTGSCPCQPFSSAGKRKGPQDDRHLWPVWFDLIKEHGPATVFGEQVASKDGLAWLDLVQSDMEGADYALGAVDTCVAGFGAPHIRQRLWFAGERLADANSQQLNRSRNTGAGGWQKPANSSTVSGMADANSHGRTPGNEAATSARHGHPIGAASCDDPDGPTGPTNGFWRSADWLFCRDGKWRPVAPGTLPLAHGVAARVGQLRAYGNAISPQAATAFIEGYTECVNL